MADLHHALPVLLQSFAEPLRREAERLAEDSAIITLDLQEGRLDAEVMLDDKPVHVCWQMKQGRWQADTDAEEPALGDLASCLALVGVKRDIAGEGRSVQEPVKETFQMAVERQLGRQLLPGEEGYLSKVEKRFERVQKTKEIFDQDMVRLHPKWPIQSYDPLALWSQTPKTAQEFWNYVALALHERGLQFPLFMKGITDLEGTRGKLASFRQDRTVPLWVERVKRFIAPRKEAVANQDLSDVRLLITTSDAKLQVRSGDGPFRTAAPEMLDILKHSHARGTPHLPAEAALLLAECLLQAGSGELESFRLEVDRNANWLAALFALPSLQTRLVTLDETPFQRSPQPLQWTAAEAADGGGIIMKLVHPDGTPAPTPLRVLHAAENYYLSGDTLFQGPAWFGDDTAVEPVITIPLAALTSSEGIAFLDKLSVPLPECLASRIRREPLGVEIVASCTKAAAGSTQYAHFRVQAVSPDGKHREVLRGSKWVVEASPPREDGLIMCHDRAALADVEPLLGDIRASFDEDLDVFRSRMTKTFPENFYEWAQNLPPDLEFRPDPSLQTILADPLIARVRLEATQTSTIDWFDLRVVFDVEGVDLKPADIRRLISAKGGFVRLADGTWRRVKLELAEDQQEMVEMLGIDLNELGDEAHRVHWRHLAGEKGAEVLDAGAWKRLQDRMARVDLEEKPQVPPGLSLTLRPYQVDGFHFLSYLTTNHFGGILADDMGLGKTVQTIAWVLWLRDRWQEERVPPTLVVCPKSVLDVWAQEFVKAASHVRVQVLHDKDELDMTALQGGIDVLVLNYAQLRGCIEQLKHVTFLAAILDEGQQIKNPDSKASKAARELKSHNRLVLTGTPLENRLLDLWSLMSFATPGALGDRGYFHKHFDRRKDERASQRLSARLRPFILRRTKGQVARELPPRTEESLLCELSGAQEQLYRDELTRAQQMVLTANGKDALSKRRFAILQALTRLRQVCCHPALVQKDAVEEESAKLTAALDLIEQLHEEGHKVLLFSQFVSMLKIIRAKLEAMNIPHHWLTGASEDRAGIVKRFQEDERASTFLISLKAGGSGLNLTAASYVILFDPWWNPAVENQAIDRAHRIGQTQPVIAYRLISKNTIEEKILMLQQHKQMLSSDILGEASFAQNLGREDFEFLLGMEERMEARQVRIEREEW